MRSLPATGSFLGTLAALCIVAAYGRAQHPAARQMRVIPSVVQRSIASALDALAWTRLRIVQVESTTTTAPPGIVLAQRPRAGTPVAATKAETLVVAAVVVPTAAVVPDLYNRTPNIVAALLKRSALTLGKEIRDYSDSVAAGRVFRQQPLPRTKVAARSAVNVWYSIGPHPAPPPPLAPTQIGRA